MHHCFRIEANSFLLIEQFQIIITHLHGSPYTTNHLPQHLTTVVGNGLLVGFGIWSVLELGYMEFSKGWFNYYCGITSIESKEMV